MGVRGRSNADVVFKVHKAGVRPWSTRSVRRSLGFGRSTSPGASRRRAVGWLSTGHCTASCQVFFFRNRQSICLDTVHLVMKYKSAFRNRESPGSSVSPSTPAPQPRVRLKQWVMILDERGLYFWNMDTGET